MSISDEVPGVIVKLFDVPTPVDVTGVVLEGRNTRKSALIVTCM